MVGPSLFYVVVIGVAYLCLFNAYWKLKLILDNLWERQSSVIAIKNFEIKSMFDSESEEETPGGEQPTIGTSNTARRGVKSAEQKLAEDKKKYKQFMKDLSGKVPKNYIDCEWFVKSNKACFLCFLVFVLAGAMEFNSVADIPSMAMVLLLMSFYAFRRTSYLTYGKLVMFMAYYMHIAVSLKVFWGMVPTIPGFTAILSDYRHDTFVRANLLLFGIKDPNAHPARHHEILMGDYAKDAAELERINKHHDITKSWLAQVFFMLLVLYSVQCWKQQRWTTIRYETAGMPEGAGSYARLIFSMEERERKKIELAKIQEIRKKLEKERKDKGKKRQGHHISRKSDKKGFAAEARKNLNSFLPSLVVWLMRILLTFQSYMYNDALGLFHLTYVLLSFILS